jgi:hypothetical protein
MTTAGIAQEAARTAAHLRQANVDSQPENHQLRQDPQERWTGAAQRLFWAQLQPEHRETFDEWSRNDRKPRRSRYERLLLERSPSPERGHDAVLTTLERTRREQWRGARRSMLLTARVLHDLLHRGAIDVAPPRLRYVDQNDQRKQHRGAR